MDQTITQFYQQAALRNFSRDFQLRIVDMQVNGIGAISDADLVFLKTASLPGKTITVQQAPYMGLDFNIPGSVKFDGSNAWQVTFYCSGDYNLRDLIESSMMDSFNEASSTGYTSPRDLLANKITLGLFDDQLNIVRQYELLGAFITNAGPINYNVTGSGAIQDVTCTIAYQYWRNTIYGPGTATSNLERTTGRINTIGGIVQGIGGTIGRVGSVLNQIGKIFGGRG